MDFDQYRSAVESLPIGKRLPDAIYLHKSALPEASKALQTFVEGLILRDAANVDWHVVKFFRRDYKVSFLSYPTFFDESYPALVGSATVDMIRGRVRNSNYSDSENPPILHRRETMISNDHPAHAQCVAITQEGEAIGLYEGSKRVGFKKSWERLIASKGYQIVDGHLVPKARLDHHCAELVGDLKIDRHRTAIHRDQLSTPMQCLARHDFLSGDHSVLDYGCGKGHDVAELEAHGVDVIGWDPQFRPKTKRRTSDLVNLGFVINVIEDRAEREIVLRKAFCLARKVLAVSVMIAGNVTIQKYTPHKDGVITSRNTFQKYYSQSEIRSFIETVLEQSAIAVAPGVFFIFKDELEEQRFLSRRQRVRREWRQLTTRDQTAASVNYQDLVESNEQLFQEFWTVCLDLGRIPANDEFDRSEELRRAIGSHKKAIDACSEYFGESDYVASRDGRIEDLTVYLALSFFGRRQAYRKMPVSLQRDIKAFFGTPSTAHEVSRLALFSVADTVKITDACLEARERLDCGHLETDHSYVVHASMLSRLPGILRIYVGCAVQLYGDIDGVDLVKIHMTSGKVSLMSYDDFTNPLPLLKDRVKVRLRDQEIDWFNYGVDYELQPLYLKSLYLAENDPLLAAQDRFDRHIANLRGIDLSEFGPTVPELERLLFDNNLSLESIEREFYEVIRTS